MNLLQAIQRLRDNPNAVTFACNEWGEAGLWHAVLNLVAQAEHGKSAWTADDVDVLIGQANQY